MLGGKWRLLILVQLAQAELRPSALRRLIPDISEKMLAQELRHLVDSQLVERQDFGEIPPRVVYRITPRGRLALPVVEAMAQFAQAYEADEHAAK